MGTAYLAVALLAAALNLTAGLWGGLLWLRKSVSIAGGWPTVIFWYLLRAAQLAVIVQVVFAAGLYLGGREPEGTLHYLYVGLPLLISLIAEAIRAGAAQHELRGVDFKALPAERQHLIALAILRRETGIMASASLISAFLLLRAFETSGYL